MDPTIQNYQPQENLAPQMPPKRGLLDFVKRHWFLLFLAAFATLLLILWVDSRSRKTEDLPNLPQVMYPKIPGQNITSVVRITLPTVTSLPSQLPTYQVQRKSLNRDQAKALASSFAFPKEPSNISSEAVLGDYYLWLSGAQSLSIRLSPLEIKIIPDPSITLPPTGGVLPTELAGKEFLNNILSLNGLLGSGVEYTKVTSRPAGDGNLLELGVSPEVFGLSVVDNDPTMQLITSYLQKDGRFYGLIYKTGFENPTSPVSYPTKDIKQIRESLTTEGKIVVLGDPQAEAELLVPTAISISGVTPSLLFVPERPDVLLPVYVLTGTATTEEGEVPVYIYLPAVKSKYVRAL